MAVGQGCNIAIFRKDMIVMSSTTEQMGKGYVNGLGWASMQFNGKSNTTLVPRAESIAQNHLINLAIDFEKERGLNPNDKLIQEVITKSVSKRLGQLHDELMLFANSLDKKLEFLGSPEELFNSFLSEGNGQILISDFKSKLKLEGNIEYYMHEKARKVLVESLGNTSNDDYHKFLNTVYPNEKILKVDLSKITDEFEQWKKENGQSRVNSYVKLYLKKGMEEKVNARLGDFLANLRLSPSDLGRAGLGNVVAEMVNADLPDAIEDYLDAEDDAINSGSEDGYDVPDWIDEVYDNRYIDERLKQFVNKEKVRQLHVEKLVEAMAEDPLTSKLPRSKWAALLSSRVSPERIEACFNVNGNVDVNKLEQLGFTLVPDLEDIA